MKRVYYYSERDLELMKKVAKSIDFGVSLDIIAALNESSSAIYYLQQDKDIYKREVKKMVGDIMKEMSRTNQEVKKPMIHKGFFFEYSDTVIDVCSDDIAAFRMSIEETLKDNNFKYAELFSYIEVARVMCEMSVKHFDTIIQDSIGKGSRNYTSEFSEFRIGGLLSKWEKLCSRLYGGCNINLNTEKSKDAFDKLADGFGSGKYVEPCLKVASEKYPEFKNTEIKTIE